MIRLLLAFLAVCISLSALAQPVQQSGGTVTPGHAAEWITNGVIGDAGTAAGSSTYNGGYLTTLGITNTGVPFCINDALTSAAGGYHQLCLGANALGGGLISYNAYGGAAQLPLQTNVNGSFSPGVPTNVSNDTVTANSITNTLATWMGYLSGTADPYGIIAGATAGTQIYFGVGTPASNWLEPLRVSTLIAKTSSLSDTGKIGLVGASRCSDNPTAADMGCIGGEFFANNDNAAYVQYSWGIYGEARRQAGAGTTQHEIDTANLGSVVDIAPGSGQTVGNTFGWNIASGAGLTGLSDASAAVLIWNNGARWRKGIVFGSDSLTSEGGQFDAIALAPGQQINWWDATNAPTGFITNNATTHVAPMGLVFLDGKIQFTDATLTMGALEIDTIASGANYAQIAPGVAGSPVRIGALGTDTNVSIDLVPKGTGVIQVGDQPGVTCSGTPSGSYAVTKGIVTHC